MSHKSNISLSNRALFYPSRKNTLQQNAESGNTTVAKKDLSKHAGTGRVGGQCRLVAERLHIVNSRFPNSPDLCSDWPRRGLRYPRVRICSKTFEGAEQPNQSNGSLVTTPPLKEKVSNTQLKSNQHTFYYLRRLFSRCYTPFRPNQTSPDQAEDLWLRSNPRDISVQWLERLGFTFSPFAFIFGTTFLFAALASTLQKQEGKQWLQNLSHAKLPGLTENKVNQMSSWVFLESVLSHYINRDNSLLVRTTSLPKDEPYSAELPQVLPQTFAFPRAKPATCIVEAGDTLTGTEFRLVASRLQIQLSPIWSQHIKKDFLGVFPRRCTPSPRLAFGEPVLSFAEQELRSASPKRLLSSAEQEQRSAIRGQPELCSGGRGQSELRSGSRGQSELRSRNELRALVLRTSEAIRRIGCLSGRFDEWIDPLSLARSTKRNLNKNTANSERAFVNPAQPVIDQGTLREPQLEKTLIWPWYKIMAYHPPNDLILPTWTEYPITGTKISETGHSKSFGSVAAQGPRAKLEAKSLFAGTKFRLVAPRLHKSVERIRLEDDSIPSKKDSVYSKKEISRDTLSACVLNIVKKSFYEYGLSIPGPAEPPNWVAGQRPDDLDKLVSIKNAGTEFRLVAERLQKLPTFSKRSVNQKLSLARGVNKSEAFGKATSWNGVPASRSVISSSSQAKPFLADVLNTADQTKALQEAGNLSGNGRLPRFPRGQVTSFSQNEFKPSLLSSTKAGKQAAIFRDIAIPKKSFWEYAHSISGYNFPELQDYEVADLFRKATASTHSKARSMPERLLSEAEQAPTAGFSTRFSEIAHRQGKFGKTAQLGSTSPAKQGFCINTDQVFLAPYLAKVPPKVLLTASTKTESLIRRGREGSRKATNRNFVSATNQNSVPARRLTKTKLAAGLDFVLELPSGITGLSPVGLQSKPNRASCSTKLTSECDRNGVPVSCCATSNLFSSHARASLEQANFGLSKTFMEVGSNLPERSSGYSLRELNEVQVSNSTGCLARLASTHGEPLEQNSKIRYTPIDLEHESKVKKAFKDLGHDYLDYLKHPKDTLPALLLSPSLEEDKQIEQEEVQRLAKEKAAAKAAERRTQNEEESISDFETKKDFTSLDLDPFGQPELRSAIEVALREGRNDTTDFEEELLNDGEMEDSKFERLRFTREVESKKEEENCRGLALSVRCQDSTAPVTSLALEKQPFRAFGFIRAKSNLNGAETEFRLPSSDLSPKFAEGEPVLSPFGAKQELRALVLRTSEASPRRGQPELRSGYQSSIGSAELLLPGTKFRLHATEGLKARSITRARYASSGNKATFLSPGVSNRKHNFFGQRSFWPTRLFSQEERLVSAHIVSPYIRYDQSNPWLLEVAPRLTGTPFRPEQAGILPVIFKGQNGVPVAPEGLKQTANCKGSPGQLLPSKAEHELTEGASAPNLALGASRPRSRNVVPGSKSSAQLVPGSPSANPCSRNVVPGSKSFARLAPEGGNRNNVPSVGGNRNYVPATLTSQPTIPGLSSTSRAHLRPLRGQPKLRSDNEPPNDESRKTEDLQNIKNLQTQARLGLVRFIHFPVVEAACSDSLVAKQPKSKTTGQNGVLFGKVAEGLTATESPQEVTNRLLRNPISEAKSRSYVPTKVDGLTTLGSKGPWVARQANSSAHSLEGRLTDQTATAASSVTEYKPVRPAVSNANQIKGSDELRQLRTLKVENKNRIYKPDPRLRLTPLESSVSADWRNSRKAEASPFRVTSKERPYIVLPKLSEHEWQKSLEWQIKRYFLEEDTRLKPLAATEPYKTFKVKTIERFLPWLTLERPSFKLSQWPYKRVGRLSVLIGSRIAGTDLAGGWFGGLLSGAEQDERAPLFSYSRIPLSTGFTTYSKDKSTLSTRSGQLFDVTKKVFSSQDDLNTELLFEPPSTSSWFLIYRLFLALILKEVFKYLYRISLRDYFIRIINSDFGRTITSSEFRQSVQFEPFPEFYRPKNRLKELIGIKNALLPLSEIIWFLRNNCRSRSGPHGLVLVGPEGVDTTAIAQAVAGEAKVPIIVQSLRALTLTHSHPQKRLEKVLLLARAQSPCVLFLDELDVIGQSREGVIRNTSGNGDSLTSLDSSQLVGGTSQLQAHYDQATSQGRRVDLMLRLLTVMDGLHHLNGVVIITTSKNTATLDPALLRPGRFDRLIHLTLPNNENRIELFKAKTRELGHTNQTPLVLANGNSVPAGFALGSPKANRSRGATNRNSAARLRRATATNSAQPSGLSRSSDRLVGGKRNSASAIVQNASAHSLLLSELELEYLSNQSTNMGGSDIVSAINYSALRAIVNETVHTVETLEYGLNCVKALKARRMLATLTRPKDECPSDRT